jgi:hypothetical protein
MALESETVFPEVVAAILDVIVPYELYQLAHSLRLEDRYSEPVREHPRAFVRLVNALIDPAVFRVPGTSSHFCRSVLPPIQRRERSGLHPSFWAAPAAECVDASGALPVHPGPQLVEERPDLWGRD